MTELKVTSKKYNDKDILQVEEDLTTAQQVEEMIEEGQKSPKFEVVYQETFSDLQQDSSINLNFKNFQLYKLYGIVISIHSDDNYDYRGVFFLDNYYYVSILLADDYNMDTYNCGLENLQTEVTLSLASQWTDHSNVKVTIYELK